VYEIDFNNNNNNNNVVKSTAALLILAFFPSFLPSFLAINFRRRLLE